MGRCLRLELIESRPRSLARALVREGLGAAVMLLLVGGTVTVQERHPSLVAMPSEETEIARFLAPLVKVTVPPPREERVEFVGLGQATANSVVTPIGSGDAQRAMSVSAGQAKGQETLVEEASDGDMPRAYTEVEVDSVAIPDPNGEAPVYPPTLLKLGVEGVVMARFVVDSTGRADINTFRLLQDSDPEFVAAVRSALVRMRYRPAIFAGRRVNQLAEQRFTFRINHPPSAI